MPRLSKIERLHGEIAINQLFSKAKRFTAYPLRVHYTYTVPSTPSRILVSVPKKLFKHAVDRNLLKRRIREAFRLHKPTMAVDMALVYMDTEIASYEAIEKAMLKIIERLEKQTTPEP